MVFLFTGCRAISRSDYSRNFSLHMRTLLKWFPLFTRYRIVRVRRRRKSSRGSRKHYLQHKETARTLVLQKLEQFNQHYALMWGKVAIRNQKTRWGSCSKNGNLNFHYRIAFLPEPLQDYIIVHELCHLKMFDHSQDFWALVAEKVSNHRACRQDLRKFSTGGTSGPYPAAL